MRKASFCFGTLFFWSILSFANFSPIQDELGYVSPAWTRQRVQLLNSLYDSSQIQIQIVIAKDTNGKSIEEFSIELADRMKLGNRETDLGLLMLLIPSQREIRIEVGQGLEGVVPDVIAKRIIEEKMLPHFRKNQFELGLDSGLDQILSLAAPQFEAQDLQYAQRRSGQGNLPLWAQILIFLFMIIFWIIGPKLGFVGPIGRGGSFGGFGGMGGSGWSGGGGGFSGGGASGQW